MAIRSSLKHSCVWTEKPETLIGPLSPSPGAPTGTRVRGGCSYEIRVRYEGRGAGTLSHNPAGHSVYPTKPVKKVSDTEMNPASFWATSWLCFGVPCGSVLGYLATLFWGTSRLCVGVPQGSVCGYLAALFRGTSRLCFGVLCSSILASLKALF